MNDYCCVKPRKLITDWRFGMTDRHTKGRKEWVDEACGVPLSSKTESGIRHSCAKGWLHPENFPVGVPRPERTCDDPSIVEKYVLVK